jgi:transcriptional regulator GlxA family with amidase domain
VQPVYFVLPPRTLLLDVSGPAEALSMANRYQDAVRFELHFVAASARVESSIGLTLSGLSKLPAALPANAMIVVSGAANPARASRQTSDAATPGARAPQAARDVAREAARPAQVGDDEAGRVIVAWLRRVARPTQRLVFICSGGLLAARAGILAQRACTTHHGDCDELRRLAPDAKVLDNRIYVADGHVYTSAGVTAGIDLMLHLIGDIAGPLCAVAVARQMVVYLRRTGADPQISPWLDRRNHLHPGVHRVQDAIAADPAHPWTLDELGAIAGASPRHLARLFQLHTGDSPLAYINALRVALARQFLTSSQFTLDHVAERAGFGSLRHLRRIWGRHHATSPARWRRAAGDAV